MEIKCDHCKNILNRDEARVIYFETDDPYMALRTEYFSCGSSTCTSHIYDRSKKSPIYQNLGIRGPNETSFPDYILYQKSLRW